MREKLICSYQSTSDLCDLAMASADLSQVNLTAHQFLSDTTRLQFLFPIQFCFGEVIIYCHVVQTAIMSDYLLTPKGCRMRTKCNLQIMSS